MSLPSNLPSRDDLRYLEEAITPSSEKPKKTYKTHDVNKMAVALNHTDIFAKEDLNNKTIRKILIKFNKDSNGFVKNHTESETLDLFKQSLKKYTKIKENKISLNFDDELIFKQVCKSIKEKFSQTISHSSPTTEEVEVEIKKFEDNYDRLSTATTTMETRSAGLKELMNANDAPFVDHLILGAGDAATEYWLDHCKPEHNTTDEKLKTTKDLPKTLLLAKDTGNWKHDYTLAQTHSLLERADAPMNPEQFATKKQYEENRHVNARHLYQANIVSMNEKEAPVLLGTTVISVEKKDKHTNVPGDWQNQGADYRVKMQMKTDEKEIFVELERDMPKWETESFEYETQEFGQAESAEDIKTLTIQKATSKYNSPKEDSQSVNKSYELIRPKLGDDDKPIVVDDKMVFIKEKFVNKFVYTNKVDICSGLGIARGLGPTQIETSIFTRLSKFDPQKGYTPLCDGNSFMLTSKEERPVPRDIIVYGGGGNATACYRKAFFRLDVRAEDRVYTANNQQATSLHWFSRDGFESAGYGKLAKMATNFAQTNDQLHGGNLIEVKEGADGKIHLFFEDAKATYENVPVNYSASMDSLHPKKIITKTVVEKGIKIDKKIPVREFVCDQFVYSIGQDSSGMKAVTQDIEKDLSLKAFTMNSGPQSVEVPVGIKTNDDKIHFWGAAAQAISPWEMDATVGKEVHRYNNNTRDWIVLRKIARDAEWPGVMPPSRAQIKYAATVGQAPGSGNIIQSVNLNIDDLGIIDHFMRDAGVVDANVRHDFLESLLKKREEAYTNLEFPGVNKQNLLDLVSKYKLENILEIKGHGSLIVKRPK